MLEEDYQHQDQNWSGTSKAPAANNDDKGIRTHFVTAGFQYMFNYKWGFQAEVPYVNRSFRTTGGATGNEIVSFNWGDLGDIRLRGIYTGLSEDLSAGLTFGVKLPSGNYTHNNEFGDIDRDTEIGSGSTDLLLGGFYRHGFMGLRHWTWFGQTELDVPLFIRDDYRPGTELDAVLGLYFGGWSIGPVGITPIGQVKGSFRTSDGGANSAHPVASGYERVLISPGIEVDWHPFSLYGDVEFPVYQRMTGNQLVAPALFKIVLSYHF